MNAPKLPHYGIHNKTFNSSSPSVSVLSTCVPGCWSFHIKSLDKILKCSLWSTHKSSICLCFKDSPFFHNLLVKWLCSSEEVYLGHVDYRDIENADRVHKSSTSNPIHQSPHFTSRIKNPGPVWEAREGKIKKDFARSKSALRRINPVSCLGAMPSHCMNVPPATALECSVIAICVEVKHQ